ncbi:pentapeptide repeat-containing protein [Catenovulum agarivorans]|uniref:pentapeptide repeat-containing protein n=1 Tax=Catenovulum agarivorans TaxID=1172192 RepID=UPI00031ED8B8|nr:pentapeptide repeat-containing protein [Catenovulum agarivorans]
MSLLWLKQSCTTLVKHHQAIHSLGIVGIGLITAVFLYIESNNTSLNAKSALLVAQSQKHLVELSILKREDEFSVSVIDRITKSVELLSSEHPTARLAGIYNLERLTADIPSESIPIIRIISSFLTAPSSNTTNNETRRAFYALLRIAEKTGLNNFLADENNIDLTNLQLENLAIKNYSFRGFIFSEAVFKNVTFHNVNFADANLTGAHFIDSEAHGRIEFRSANLTHSQFENCDFSQASFASANLAEAKLRNSTFHNVDFSHANLNKTIISHVEFDGSVGLAENIFLK